MFRLTEPFVECNNDLMCDLAELCEAVETLANRHGYPWIVVTLFDTNPDK